MTEWLERAIAPVKALDDETGCDQTPSQTLAWECRSAELPASFSFGKLEPPMAGWLVTKLELGN